MDRSDDDAKPRAWALVLTGLLAIALALRLPGIAAWYDPMVEMWLGKLTPEETLAKIDANLASIRQQRKTAQ